MNYWFGIYRTGKEVKEVIQKEKDRLNKLKKNPLYGLTSEHYKQGLIALKNIQIELGLEGD